MVILIFLSTAREREIFQRSFKARGITLAQALEAGIGSREELKDVEKLQSSIYKLMWLDPEIAKIHISVSTPKGLQIIASNDTGAIGTPSDPENKAAFEQDIVRTRTLYQPGAPSLLSVITPVHVGGQQLGTYDITLSLEAEETALRSQQAQLLLYLVATIAFIMLSLSLLLRRTVINPILEVRKGSEKIKAGDLGWRIAVKGKDELGELARTFNEMATKLQQNQVELGQTVANLKQAKAKDEAMLTGIGDGLVATDKNGLIVLVNNGFENILGWKKSEVQGKLLSEVIPVTDENGTKIPESERLVTKTLKEHTTTTTT
ncbi:MAG: HAMP domain-containing protein, partial [Ignavibacteria bacterium]|nr:HAMP domain-containing protein [Ignavibacteria bacterium]